LLTAIGLFGIVDPPDEGKKEEYIRYTNVGESQESEGYSNVGENEKSVGYLNVGETEKTKQKKRCVY